MASFNRLCAEIKQCTLCEADLPLGPRPVFQAHPKARILVVGQAPGTAVHKSGIPFDDPSGDRLRTWMGVDKETFYNPHAIALIPMGFCYPGRGKGGDLPPRPECAETWRTPLLSHMKNVKLTIVIGRYAIDWHLQPPKSTTLTEFVTRWRDFGPEVVALPHPSPRNTMWLRRNPIVEAEVVPYLQARVRDLLS
ncbi:MAG: uracil-DNA glycosylase family protein [Pseudomonadota bacterium]